MRKLTILLLFLGFGFLGSSQSNLAIGEWKAYFPNLSSITVSQSANKVYYGTNNSIYSIDKDDFGLIFMTTAEGLSEADIERIKYSPFTDVLAVAYENSNIDLIFENEIVNVSDIVDNQSINGSRTINDIYFRNAELAYFSTDFGLVEYNISKREFGFTTFTDLEVHNLEVHNDQYFMSTLDGIYVLDISESVNPSDFSKWQLLSTEVNLPSAYSSEEIIVYDGKVYADVDGDVYRREDNGDFELFYTLDGFKVEYLSADMEHLIVGFMCDAGNCGGRVRFFNKEGNEVGGGGSFCIERPFNAVEDEQGRIWYADEFNGLRYSTGPTAGCTKEKFNAPRSSLVYDIGARGDMVVYSTGGVSGSFGFSFKKQGFCILPGSGEWINHYNDVTPFFQERNIFDYLSVEFHPTDPNKFFIGTYSRGIIEVTNLDSFFLWNQENSTLRGTPGTETADRVTGLAYDSEGNLWASNYLAKEALSVYMNTGEWRSYEVPGNTTFTALEVDHQDNKWMVDRALNVGFVIFNEGDPNDPEDDQFRAVSPGNSELESASVNCIVTDRDGDVWVGTSQGPVVFDCPDPFSTNCRGLRKKVELDGFIAFLLETENITAIGIDGANRKWFGSNNGIYVLSADAQDQLAHFTAENSPLPSNIIRAITVNPDNGEVYIGTGKGLMSYRTDATTGGDFHESEVKVFPNPVRPEYEGPIAIDGLAEDAIVRITDVSGKIVYEVKANGGQAIWFGRDLEGDEVSSGVYLVFSSSNDNLRDPDTAVGKILYVRD